MGIVHQWLCDMCGEILSGKKGTASIEKEYISIRGTLTIQDVDEVTKRKIFTYTSRSEQDTMTFCNYKCMGAYIDMRKKLNADTGKYFDSGSRPQWQNGGGTNY